MNHWHYGLRPTRRCCADFGNDSNETGSNFRYSIPTGFAGISRPPTPPCGRCGSAARGREASASLHTVARWSGRVGRNKRSALRRPNRLTAKNQHRRAQRHATSRYGGPDRLARTQASRWVRTLAASRGFRTGMAQCATLIAPYLPLAGSGIGGSPDPKCAWSGHLKTVANDPQETSPALSEPDIMALITPVFQGSIRSHQPVAVSTCRANLSRVW